jgi:hypothetical protein
MSIALSARYRFVSVHLNMRIDTQDFSFGRIQLKAAHIFSAVDDLSLQVAEVHDIKTTNLIRPIPAAARYNPSGAPSPPVPTKRTLPP